MICETHPDTFTWFVLTLILSLHQQDEKVKFSYAPNNLFTVSSSKLMA